MKAVMLAAGQGTRMQASDVATAQDLSEDQRRAAAEGRKALIPFHGHPFLGYSLTELADGGITDVCIVTSPAHQDSIREWIEGVHPKRIRLEVAIQERPEGSARAVGAARDFLGDDPFMVVNGDNLYPSAVLDRVRRLTGHGLAGFSQKGLVGGTISRERLSAFALVARDSEDRLEAIVEKPAPEARRRMGLGDDALVSMTCWRFEPEIFEMLDDLAPSVRGEYEIPDAVMRLVRERGRTVQVVPVHDTVLDLTHRRDIRVVDELLRGRTVRL